MNNIQIRADADLKTYYTNQITHDDGTPRILYAEPPVIITSDWPPEHWKPEHGTWWYISQRKLLLEFRCHNGGNPYCGDAPYWRNIAITDSDRAVLELIADIQGY
jgi:hypothetical protein